MVGCSVLGCKSRSERNVSGVTFHKYPSNPDILSKWMDATGKQNWLPNKYSKMCSLHFDEDSLIQCKKIVQLKKDSVPSRKIHIVPTPEKKKVPEIRECRSCLQILKKDAVSYNIFQSCRTRWNRTGNTIAKDLAKLANVQISETDRYSKLICDTCFHLLLSACRFKSLVRKNDHILRLRNTVPSKDVNSSNENKWPKSIQVDKSLNKVTNEENILNEDINQEVKDECSTTNDTYNEPKDVNSSNENMWPKPIQVDKSLIKVMDNENLLNEDIKQEVKEGCSTTNDTYGEPKDIDIQNIDILKIEPEEIIQYEPPSIQEIVKASLPVDNLNTELTHTSNITTDDDEKMEEEWLIEEEEEEKVEPIVPHLPIARANVSNSVQGLKVHVIAQPLYKSVKRKGNSFPLGGKAIPFQYKKKAKELICALCGETFTDDYYMKIHQDIHHSNIEENVDGSDKYNIKSTGDTPE